MEERKICKKCVLPESRPDIVFDQEGVCNVCAEYSKTKDEVSQSKPLESEFVKMLKMYRSNGEYDCLVMCSGGKDSTAALYYMCKRYKLKRLAFTFDHGFETEEALENVRNAARSLGVDYLTFKSDYMQEMFSEILTSSSRAVICHPCSLWYMDLAFKMAYRFNIPMIIAGWTKGQSSRQPLMSRCGCNTHQQEFISMGKATQEFVEKYVKTNPKYKDFPSSMEEVLLRAKRRQKCAVLSPHWFLPFGSEVYVETIKKELGWKQPAVSYPAGSTNCSLNFISVNNSLKYFGYTHYHVEMSKMIREGMMTRDEALQAPKVNDSIDDLNQIAKPLGYTFTE